MNKSALTILLCWLGSFSALGSENLVLDRYPITNTRSAFCDHKFLPFPCYRNQFGNSPFLPEFFSLIGNSFTIQIVSDDENFTSIDNGIFSVGKFKPDLLKHDDLVSLGNFYRRGPEWKKSGELIVWNNGVKIYSSKLEFQINGQDSRSAPQKAIRLKLALPIALSNYAPRSGLKRLTIYPIYRSLGGAKILHYVINEIFRKNEIWFEKWQVTPVMINQEYWGTYLLARPDLEIQEDYFGSTEGVEGVDFKEKILKNKKYKFNKDDLLKFIAFQSVVGNEDLPHNFRSFINQVNKNEEINFTYTDLDETFNNGHSLEQIAKDMGSEEIIKIYQSNVNKCEKYKTYWNKIFNMNDAGAIFNQFNRDNFLYILFNDLRWGRPFRSNENKDIKDKIENFVSSNKRK